MAGGSQLSQLKARIKSEGISDRRQQSKSAKNKKKQNNNKNAKQSPDESAAARAARLAAIVGDNPFESKITKQKHQVLTLKKPKTIAGKPGAAKQAAISARQAQLLPEYHARAKAGSFVDRRFGENDPTLTPEERMLERFTKEKQRRSARNSSAFNLNDGEDDFQLTHYGQSLSGLDDLDDIPLDDDDEEGGLSGNIDKNTTSRSHFGGFQEKEQDGDQDGEERKKSKAEVMSEIIAKSKFAKHERQKVKDADDDLRHELDAELGDIRGLLFSMAPVENKDSKEDEEAAKDKAKAYGDPSKSGPNAIPLGGKKAPTAEEKKAEADSEIDQATSSSLSKPNLIGNSYDAFVRELAFDRRAKPTDRLKTEAELAAEQAELLQKQERARLKRMRGERDDSDEDDDGTSRKRGRKGGAPQGDDLDDDFVFDGETAADVYGLGRGLGDMSDEDGQDGEEDGDDDVDLEDLEEEGDSKEEDIADGDDSEGEDGEDEDDDDEDDGEEGDDEFQDMVDPNALAQPGEDEDEDIGGDHQDLVTETRKSSKKDKSPSSTKAKESAPAPTLPFTFPCPRTHAEFLDLLEKHQVQPSDVPTVVKRIRTLYHASLAEENKFKLQAILGVLLDHALYVAGLKGRHDASGSATGGYDLVNALIPPIFELTKTYPLVSAQHFVAKLTLMQRNLQRGLAAGALLPTSRTWPKSGGELVLLRIAGAVWPTSDWQHPVSTPRSLLLAQYLAHARLRCTGDVACALYLVSLVVEGEAFSRRIVPEALNALGQCMVLLGAAAIEATEEGWKRVQEAQVQWGLPMPDVGADHTRNVGIALHEESSNAEDEVTRSLPFMLNLGVEQDGKDPATSQAVASQLLHSTFTLVERFAKLYNGSPAFVELFEPFLALLSAFPAEGAGLSPRTGQAMIHLTHSLSRQVSLAASSRRSLRLQAHRAVSIASYVPKFDQDGRGGASRLRGGVFDPNPERAEASKLRAQLKQEKKGAMRELRRDNAFLAEVREGERREEEKSYKRKMDKIMSGLQEERSEEKALAREKAKLKRRAGGK
ncbi:nucleolar complex protein 14 [Tilletia horrida]|uniref:Nucleolar complex protein 14 n=1 Tax=Tilletia horrida TaxID=155126 RepID=A0AAN6GI92_9BASI|nr:nucleolar complex protein 14 [Tilletia horrida]